MILADFKTSLSGSDPVDLARNYLHANEIAAVPDSGAYEQYKARAAAILGDCEGIAIAGSGNWRFSLNPEKTFREFGRHSDIDLVAISPAHYHGLWKEMRSMQRRMWHRCDQLERSRIRRHGENVYAGFISPSWIPFRAPERRLEHKRALNALSDDIVAYLPVKIYFFKNWSEAVDYYQRGFAIAKRSLA